jgi:ParB family chromosome partitioning protein
LAVGTGLIDRLGQHLKIDCLEHWQPDGTFFALVKDREAVTAMLSEVIGEQAANSYLTDPGTKKKDIIRKALAGDGRTRVEGWMPRYMAFAQAQYTARALMGAAQQAA